MVSDWLKIAFYSLSCKTRTIAGRKVLVFRLSKQFIVGNAKPSLGDYTNMVD